MILAHPDIRREKLSNRPRNLTVLSREHLSPSIIRVTLGGPDLEGFESLGFDDHFKLVLPDGQTRDFTPRGHDPDAAELTVDFALHARGPAADWARRAEPGQQIEIRGPKGSRIAEGGISRWLLVGDEAALPAMGRFLEEAPAGLPVRVIAAVAGPADELGFETRADLTLHWLHRPLRRATDTAPFLAALDWVQPGPGLFAWIAAEAGVTAALRTWLEARGHPPTWLRASGYWQADSS